MVPATAWGSCPRLSANFRASADVSARRSAGEKPGNLFSRCGAETARWSHERRPSVQLRSPRPGQVCKRPKQRGCKPRPFGVRTFESMPCPPCDRSSKAEPHVANVKTPDRYRPVAPVRPVSKSGDCLGLKNRRGRIETGAGHHFGPLVITGARRSCKPEDGFRLPDGPPRSE